MTHDTAKFPYSFTELQINTLARTIGNEEWYQDQDLQGVNLEIGIAQTRDALSSVKENVERVMGHTRSKTITLYLTDQEAEAVIRVVKDDGIRGILRG